MLVNIRVLKKKSIVDSRCGIPFGTTRKRCRSFGKSIGGQRCRLEGRTLLHDRDVLLSGNHLCDLLERGRIGNTELTAAAGGQNCTLTVLLSGDGQIWRRRGPDLPWVEKFQKLVEVVGLGLCENC